MKMLKNRLGFTLVGMLVSVLITGLAFVAAADLIKFCFNMSELRMNIVDKDIEQQIGVLHGIIKNAYMKTSAETLASGVPAAQTETATVLQSNFIPADNTYVTTVLRYDSSQNAILANDKVVVANVTDCTFSYYDLYRKPTTDSLQIKSVAINMTYIPDPRLPDTAKRYVEATLKY